MSIACLDNRSFCEEYYSEVCAFAEECCEDEEKALLHSFLGGQYINDAGECRSRVQPACASQEANDEAIANGRMEFDAEKARECLDKIKEAREKCDGDLPDECSPGELNT